MGNCRIFCFALLLISGLTYGQEYEFINFNFDDGLPSLEITDIIQDKDGFIWLGTMNGVTKFDGYSFKSYQHNQFDTTSLSNNAVWQLELDSAGTIWVGTSGGLNRYDHYSETFVSYRHNDSVANSITNNTIYALEIDLLNRIWAGSVYEGLNLYDEETDGFNAFLEDSIIENSLIHNSIRSMHVDAKGIVWIGTSSGLSRYDPVRKKFKNFVPNSDSNSLSGANITCIQSDKDGNIWIGTHQSGLNKYIPETGKFELFIKGEDELSLHTNRIKDIYIDSKNRIWIATVNGLSLFDETNGTFTKIQNDPSNNNSLIHNQVNRIFEDKRGNMWFGTYAGLSLLSSKKKGMSHLLPGGEYPKSLSQNMVWGVTRDRDFNLWVGTWSGLRKFNPDLSTSTYYQMSDEQISITDSNIRTIITAEDGKIWIATHGGGIDIYDPEVDSFTSYRHNKLDSGSIVNDFVRVLFEDDKGDIWAGTRLGLDKFNATSKTFEHYNVHPSDPKLNKNDIRTLLKSNKGTFWLTTNTGVFRYNPETSVFDGFDINPGYPTSSVYSLAQDSKGNILFTSYGSGLSYYIEERDTLIQFRKADGRIFSDGCSCAIFDDHDNAWVADGHGIVKLNLQTGDFTRYDKTDGAGALSYNIGICYKDKLGWIYFGSSKGLTYFHPDSLGLSNYQSDVQLTNFQLFNMDVPLIKQKANINKLPFDFRLTQVINKTQSLTLPYNASVISFEYASLDFPYSERNAYKYMLENYDIGWNDVGKQRKATYTNLNPGEYVFRIKATNNDGVWSSKEINLPITITPPWWLTWWMKLLYWILSIGIPISVYFLRVTSLKQQRKKLEVEVANRTKQIVHQKEEIETQAEELQATNDKLLELDKFKNSMTHMIVHDFKNSLNTIINFSSEFSGNKVMRSIYNAGRNINELVLNMLDIQKFEEAKVQLSMVKRNFDDVINSSIEQVHPLLESKELSIVTKLSNGLHIEFDKNIIERVIVNLLTNAIKFSPIKGEIEVTTSLEYQKFKLSISDQGLGVTEQHAEIIFNRYVQIESKDSGDSRSTGLGLAFCRLAIEAHGGQIGVVSGESKGATFWFSFPVPGDVNIESILHEDKIDTQIELNLTDKDKVYLKPYVDRLEQLELHKFTQIIRVLSEIDEHRSTDIGNWKNGVEGALRHSDEEQFEALIQMVK